MSYASEYYGGGAGEASPVDVATAAANPKQASGDGVSMTAHSLPDLIAADKYERAKAAGRNKSRGIRFARFVPPGTTSSNEDAR